MKIWIVGIHSEAMFKVIAVAESEEEAKKIGEALETLGKPLIWQAELIERKEGS